MDLMKLTDLERGSGAALLHATTAMGFSEQVARAGLRAEFEAWSASGVFERLQAEIEKSPSNRPSRVLVIGASTLPASLLRQVFLARIVGARVAVKTASGQEELAEAIAEADDQVTPTPFASDDAGRLRAAIDAVDTIVALGSDETVNTIAGHVPFHKTFVGHGHKVSAAWVETPDQAAADGLAYDLCAWDQAGCLSPQVAWVNGDRAAFAERLLVAVSRLEKELPMTLPREAVRARRVATTLGHMSGEVYESKTACLVSLSRPDFRLSPGYRMLWLLPAERDACRMIGPSLGALGTNAPVLDGVEVTTRLGQMQRPPIGFGDGGIGSLMRAQ